MIKVIDNFITEEEEKQLLSNIPLSRVTVGDGRNTVTRYGSSLPYFGKIKSPTIPKWLYSVCEKVALEWIPIQHVPGRMPDSVTINEYHTTQGINWHIDSPTSGPIITVLSLKTSAIMGLRKGTAIMEQPLPQRSLLILTEGERWDWEHCIYPVSAPRLSIVFRKGTK